VDFDPDLDEADAIDEDEDDDEGVSPPRLDLKLLALALLALVPDPIILEGLFFLATSVDALISASDEKLLLLLLAVAPWPFVGENLLAGGGGFEEEVS